MCAVAQKICQIEHDEANIEFSSAELALVVAMNEYAQHSRTTARARVVGGPVFSWQRRTWMPTNEKTGNKYGRSQKSGHRVFDGVSHRLSVRGGNQIRIVRTAIVSIPYKK